MTLPAGIPEDPVLSSPGFRRLAILVSKALVAPDIHTRYAYSERALAEIILKEMPGWTNTVISRTKINTAIAMARGQPHPVSVAIKEIRRMGEMQTRVTGAFESDEDFE